MKAASALLVALVAFGGAVGSSAVGLRITDADVLNFAVQTECLAAAFYTAAATGQNLSADLLGPGGGPIIGAQKAVLEGSALDLATEFAADTQAQLRTLRTALGAAALPCPEIDIGYAFNGFVNLTLAALKNANPYAPFTPYASFINFYFGAFILADPDVFAYNGAAPLIADKGALLTAAKILAIKSYQAGAVRANLATIAELPTPYGINVTSATNALAAVRAALQGATTDFGIANRAGSTLTNADVDSLVFARSVEATLGFLYQTGSPLKAGGFLPKGINGIFAPANLAAIGG